MRNKCKGGKKKGGKKFAAFAMAMLVPALSFGHDCENHDLSATIRIPDISIQGLWSENSFSIAIPYEVLWDEAPGGYGLRIPVYYSASHPGYGFIQTIFEFDETLFDYQGFEIGPAFEGGSVYTTVYESPLPPNYCPVTDNTSHEVDDVLLQIIEYAENLPDAGDNQILGWLKFSIPNMAATGGTPYQPTWEGWETAATFSVKCARDYNSQSISAIHLFVDHPGPNNDDCILQWGDGGFVPISGCVTFDLAGAYTTERANWCSDVYLGDTCISCPGCNYYGECFDDTGIIICNKTPSLCQELTPSKTTAITTPTWSVVKGLYR